MSPIRPKNGSARRITSLVSVVRFTHVPTGTYIDVMAPGEGADAGDKSSPKAATGAYKYALRQTFLIETGDDPDKDASGPQEQAPKTARPDFSRAKPAAEPDPSTTPDPWMEQARLQLKEWGLKATELAVITKQEGGTGIDKLRAFAASLPNAADPFDALMTIARRELAEKKDA